MKKVEAPTLEAAYEKAAKVLECSISELQCEVVQHPSKGILGLLKKNAIIVATCNKTKNERVEKVLPIAEKELVDEIIATVKQDLQQTQDTTVLAPLPESKLKQESIVDNFFDADREGSNESIEEIVEEVSVVYDELALHIENEIKVLMSASCFDIDIVEVDVVDNTALIFIDGNDAALLIGKEGYRYNALSYMLFNWLHSKYELFIKLEIAEFVTMQKEMIRNTIKPVINQIETTGKGKTRFLDGILVQLALEELRSRFPNKYVAVKSTKEGKKFIVINDFHSKLNV